MATVINITDKNQLEQILQEAKNVTSGSPTTVVMDFYATWCRPCSDIAPVFKELSTRYTNMKFIKIDVDKLEDVAQRYNVRSLPTFIFLRGAEQIDRITGATPQKLRDKVQELSISELDTHEGGSHRSLLSSKQYDMDALLSKGQCECLNEEDSHSLAQLLNSSGGNNSKAYLLSDTDEQLIIYITFTQFVRIQSIQINGPKENAPKTVKLFINQISTPDFDSCEIGEAVQTLELTEDDIKDGGITQLNFVKFQNVNTLTIFVKNNQSSTDQTRIDKLKFYGYPVNTVNMKEFQRVSGKKGEAHG
ncbi:hypothetical protein MN116_008522 [Schistosoma mekongi]|uniref:Thioredoxin-like protein 1 n=1 Tax=Schistosoma mekongi TaxID=38744 RepID=A0AAE1Z5T3_SCHME|nr:hypothetical protein MN116_008522 [Schistosoma mekongi]